MKQYEFRYKLDDDSVETDISSLEEFYQDMIVSLLEIVELTNLGSVVKIDGFKFINSSKCISLFNSKEKEKFISEQNQE